MDELDNMNMSELLSFAQDHEPNAHRGLPREVLIELALGEEHELPARKIDKYRLKIMQFINEHFEQVGPFIQACPAKTRNPRACFECTDVQVIECTLTNETVIFKSSKK